MDSLSIYSKLISESLLSLYPIFVKKINLPIDIQMWTRLITYVLISLFFINYSWVTTNLFVLESVELSFVNIFHIYCSYEGFLNLDSGVAFSIFNIYPILILLFSGIAWKKEYFLALIGLIFFIYSSVLDEKKNKSHLSFIYGFGMILLSAITEALIYFIVKNIKTDNNWNHLFVAYFFGSILLSLYMFGNYIDSNYFISNPDNLENSFKKLSETKSKINYENISLIGLALIINGLIGSIGYFLRFYSVYRLDPGIYSILSFFGILTAYFYGIIFNGESIDIYKIIGTILIILSNYLIL
jgi:drug/metabolite transporter (DMT)-like permease